MNVVECGQKKPVNVKINDISFEEQDVLWKKKMFLSI